MTDYDNLKRPSAAAEYLGVTMTRLNQIRKAWNETGRTFGTEIDGRWFYPISHLDAYKAERDQHPKGGRPQGVKTDDLIPSPGIRAAA